MNKSNGWRRTFPRRESAAQFEANLRAALSVQNTGRPGALIGAGRYWVASLINHRLTVQLDAGRLVIGAQEARHA